MAQEVNVVRKCNDAIQLCKLALERPEHVPAVRQVEFYNLWSALEPLLKDQIFESKVKFASRILYKLGDDKLAEKAWGPIPVSTIVVLATAEFVSFGPESYKMLIRYLEIVSYCYESEHARA